MGFDGEKKDLVKVGSLWKRTSKSSGYVYLSGEIEVNGEKVKVMVFPVKPEWKKTDKYPDFEIKVEEGDLGAKKGAKKALPQAAKPAKPAEDLSEFGI
jgi:hypothetical protein